MKKSSKKVASTIALTLALMLTLTACGSSNTATPTTSPKGTTEPTQTPKTSETPSTEPTGFKQSPMLDGKGLPDVKDRLPKEPKLINEIAAEDNFVSEIGVYGGTMNTITSVIDWSADTFLGHNEGLLTSPSVLGNEVTQNVLKGYEVSSDNKEFTFFLRDGLKWSDGEPVTMEDFEFTIENFIFNQEITPVVPAWLKSGGKVDGDPMKFEVVDDLTFKISFTQPYGGFLVNLSVVSWRGYTELLKPKHYLSKYHKDMPQYDEKAVDEVAKKNNFADDAQKWINVFNAVDITNWELTQKTSIGFPKLYPWILTETTDSLHTYERNPYYWKVDAEGNQLPYIDKFTTELVQDMEMVTLKYISGAANYARESASSVNMAMYKEGEEKGNYKTLTTTGLGLGNSTFLNMTYDDPTYQSVVQNVEFRRALNYAIDKEEMCDAIMSGLAQPSYLVDSEFNVDKANETLDKMGMDKKDKNGHRLAPNGEPFSILFEVGAEAPSIVPAAELITEMWQNVGINATMKRIEGSLVGNKSAANEIQGRVIWCSGDVWYNQDWGYDNWGRSWNIWKTKATKATITNDDGTTKEVDIKGTEPPQEVKNFYAMVDETMVASTEKALEIQKDILKNMKENIWFFPYFTQEAAPTLVSSNLGNVDEDMNSLGLNYNLEQMFYKK